jgi:hypothetical protein
MSETMCFTEAFAAGIDPHGVRAGTTFLPAASASACWEP